MSSRFSVLGALVFALTVAAGSSTSEEPAPEPVVIPDDAITVAYTSEGFIPKRLEIEAGQYVKFVNDSEDRMWPASSIHPTHQIYPGFDARRIIDPGEAWAFKFDQAGFWRYHNHMAPTVNGIVIATGGDDAPTPVPLVMDPGDLSFEKPRDLSPKDAVQLFRDDTLLQRFTKKYGPAQMVMLMAEAEKRIDVDCHQRAHDVGRLAYDYFGAAAFSLASHECQSGAYHGATEALFRQRGTANLEGDVAALCGSTPNPFLHHQCVHGVGHGLLAWTSYELLDALPMCDKLGGDIDTLSCYSGIFMENVVGGLSGSMGHATEYLSDDPHFPCNILSKKYAAPCYYYQTSRMVSLYDRDFAKVTAVCEEAPEVAHRNCFLSMGRDVGLDSRGDPVLAIELCAHATDLTNRVSCIEGTAQDRFWHESFADEALALCHLIEGWDEKSGCYWTIINRARNLYASSADFDSFCVRVEAEFRHWCKGPG